MAHRSKKAFSDLSNVVVGKGTCLKEIHTIRLSKLKNRKQCVTLHHFSTRLTTKLQYNVSNLLTDTLLTHYQTLLIYAHTFYNAKTL